MKPKCLECVFFTRWEQASGGTVPRCARFEAVEEMIRTEMRLWNVSGNWASTYEGDEYPSYPSGEVEPEYICQELDRDMEAAAQEWFDSRLIRLERTGPTFRSVASIEEDVMWKFQSCRDFEEMPEEELWDDPLFYNHYSYPEGKDTDPSEPTLAQSLVDEIKRLFPGAVEILSVPVGCP
jgi:hypothetical protein